MSRRDDHDATDRTAVQRARWQGSQWARQLLVRDDWVLLDTETTGLDRSAEVIELALLAPSGQVLVDSLLRPQTPIPLAASAIHGLTDETVQDAPTMVELWPDLLPLLGGKRLVAYHVAFDVRVLRQTAARYALPFPLQVRTACAMEAYALFCGRRSAATGRPARQTLAAACAQLGIVEAAGASFHRAADDCRATLALLHAMARWRVEDDDGTADADRSECPAVIFAPAAVPPSPSSSCSSSMRDTVRPHCGARTDWPMGTAEIAPFAGTGETELTACPPRPKHTASPIGTTHRHQLLRCAPLRHTACTRPASHRTRGRRSCFRPSVPLGQTSGVAASSRVHVWRRCWSPLVRIRWC